MNKKEDIRYLDYMTLIREKNDILKKLEYLVNSDASKIDISSLELSLLFLIDFNNLNFDIYEDSNLDLIKDLINNNKSLDIYSYSKNHFSNILDLTKDGRVTSSINRTIALEYANYYNKKCSREDMIDIYFLDGILQNIK